MERNNCKKNIYVIIGKKGDQALDNLNFVTQMKLNSEEHRILGKKWVKSWSVPYASATVIFGN